MDIDKHARKVLDELAPKAWDEVTRGAAPGGEGWVDKGSREGRAPADVEQAGED